VIKWILIAGLVAMVGWLGWNALISDIQAPSSVVPLASQNAASAKRDEQETASSRHRVRINSLRIAFEQSNDLSAFVRSLSARAAAGDADALWLISRSVDYCTTYGKNPAAFTSVTEILLANAPPEAVHSVKTVRERTAARCRGFIASNDGNVFSSSAALANKVRAARAGSLPAEAALLLAKAPLSTDSAYLTNLVDRVQRSGDPEAYLAISDAMGTMASGHEKIFGSNSGSEISTFAWQLAACRRGLDCSPTGSLMSMYCLHGGVCGNFSSFEDLVFRGLAPESDKTRINAMVNRITSRGDAL
jgi:hypothetical protein